MKSSLLTIERPANALIFCRTRDSLTIRQEMGDLMDRAQAIVDLAADENRELTDQDRREIDEIVGVGEPGEAGHKPGKVEKMKADLNRAEKLEGLNNELSGSQSGSMFQSAAGLNDEGRGEVSSVRASRIAVPIEADFQYGNGGKLKAFSGPHAKQEAYLTGQFLLATLWGNASAQQWCNSRGVDTKFYAAMGGGSDSKGGFLIPIEMERRIIELREIYGAFRRNAEPVPMMGDVKVHPYLNTDLEATFVGENQALDESEPAWGMAELVAKKIGAIVRYSTEVAEDAVISIADALTRQFARAFALKEDRCGFNGDGTSPYGGIVGLSGALKAGSIVTAAAGNVNFPTLDLADFEAMIGLLPDFASIEPKWYISKMGWATSMQRLMNAAGGNTNQNIAAGVPLEFLGHPVEIVHVMPKALTGTTETILAYFGDLMLSALLGNRRGMTLMVSDERYFEFDQVGIRGTERFDITIHSTGTDTEPGAIVALKTPGS